MMRNDIEDVGNRVENFRASATTLSLFGGFGAPALSPGRSPTRFPRMASGWATDGQRLSMDNQLMIIINGKVRKQLYRLRRSS